MFSARSGAAGIEFGGAIGFVSDPLASGFSSRRGGISAIASGELASGIFTGESVESWAGGLGCGSGAVDVSVPW